MHVSLRINQRKKKTFHANKISNYKQVTKFLLRQSYGIHIPWYPNILVYIIPSKKQSVNKCNVTRTFLFKMAAPV